MAPARSHMVEHAPRLEDGCNCGAALANHKIRKSTNRKDKKRVSARPRLNSRKWAARTYFVGIDGEGQGRDDHRYVLLAWSNQDGSRSDHIEAKPGKRLTTEECLDFLLDMPIYTRAFAYAFNYDLTKMLQDVDDRTLYLLFRPELRKRKPGYEKFGPKPVPWKKYSLNLVGTKFTVKCDRRIRVVWDIFKFFQSKFTTALIDWKVADKKTLEHMAEMKEKRADFDKLDPAQVRAYCYEECRYMAALAEKLTVAHEDAGIPLRNYFGAGSSAGGMLKLMGIGEQERETPKKMEHAVACAFFGGRFENSVVGEVEGPVWSYDISAAYPYQLYHLPCLACGRWSLTKKRKDIETARAALVHYGLGKPPKDIVWGPFPYRMETGSIAFPATSPGGWVWREEYLQGERLFPHVRFKEAWIYKGNCHHRPFEMIPKFYVERLRIGKEGPGIVLKLGSNSCYGKLAQSIGTNPPFQCWIWAGMITSGTRAQLLEAIGLHKDRRNLLMTATDGLASRERLKLPAPIDTGTADAIDDKGDLANKPLGGWEEKRLEKGMFLARPGIYFPLQPTEDELKQVRARGVGRKTMLDAWKLAVEAWRRREMKVSLPNVSRFCGAKSSISRTIDEKGRFRYNRLQSVKHSYGQWKTREVVMSFSPLPKRERINDDGTLEIRYFGRKMGESRPYDRSLVSEDALLLKLATMEMMEQPDGDSLTDYEDEDRP